MEPQPIIERQPAIVHLPRSVQLDEDQLWDICQANPDWQFELSAGGDLIIMPPSGGRTGARNLKIALQLGRWADSDGTGVAFDSSTGFVLSNGAIRSPDAAWVARDRLDRIAEGDRERFLRVSPNFVIELRSPTDSLAGLQQKLDEYVRNGVALGWLIDPATRSVYSFRPDQPLRLYAGIANLAADDVLPGFLLDLEPIWHPGV